MYIYTHFYYTMYMHIYIRVNKYILSNLVVLQRGMLGAKTGFLVWWNFKLQVASGAH